MIRLKLASFTLIFMLVLFVLPLKAAALQAATPSAKVSFTFDDGYSSTYTQAAPILAKYGFTATEYATTGCIGMTTKPNKCHANTSATYMSWQQLQVLQNSYHWEIGSHTATHPYLASTNASDGQPNLLTPTQIDYELNQSKVDLAAHGINAVDFASPYGDYNNYVLADSARYYQSQRGYADTGYNKWPYSDYLLRVQPILRTTSVATVKSYINTALANNYWLILVFHDIKDGSGKYTYTSANLDKVATYVKSLNMPVVNVQAGLVQGDQNLLPNSSFNSGISAGWTTPTPAYVTTDSAFDGNYPDPTYSTKLASGTATAYLMSPLVRVDPTATYVLKNYLNMQNGGGGQIGFYIDEYNNLGQWISGQYKATEKSSFVESVNFAYKPTSASVALARLQIFMTPSSGGAAYIDNSQWFAATAASPVPVPANLITNGTFDAGLSQGWTTDRPLFITLDTTNHGSPANPANSIKLTSTNVNAHLFSPPVMIDNAKNYSLAAYLNVAQISSGEVGFYIDEYDASGHWISGQYKSGVRSVAAGNVYLSYAPTSAQVGSASLQVIIVGNSNIVAYFDDVIWQAN